MTIVAAADGSALGNPGPAGWAWYVDQDCWHAGGWPHGTNNQGELMAVLDLFRSTAHVADQPLHILCDSQYVINCITKWMPGWKRKGWRKADGKPVLNVDMLKDIDAAIVGRTYKFEWVKGHAGHDLNEAADDRARDAATAYQAKRQPVSGPGFPGAAANLPATTANAAANTGTTAAANSSASTTAPSASAAKAPAASAPRATSSLPPAGIGQLAPDAEPDLFSMLEDGYEEPAQSAAEVVVALEQELLTPAVRSDAGRVAELLHPDFEEFGASGRMWTRDDMLDSMAADGLKDPSMEVLNVNVLDDSTALLTYRSTDQRGTALRSSLWRLTGGHWRLRFHQGTFES